VSTVAGSYDRRTVEAAVDAPLVKDKVLVRLAAITSGRRGYVHDLSNNMDYGDENYSVVRGSLVWKISDKLENYTLLQHSRADTVGSSSGLWVLDDFNFNASQSSQNNALRALNGGTQAAYDALRAQLLARARKAGPYTIIGTSVGCASANGPVQGPATVTALDYPSRSCPHDYYVDDRAINTTTYNINGNWSLKNIYGYVRSKQYQGPFDVDGSPLILTDIRSPYQSAAFPIFRSWSDEIQLHGSAGLFDITAGAFYYRQKQDTGIVYADFNRSTSVSRTDSGAENRAIYGQADIHLDGVLPGLTGTVGLRGTQSLLEQTIYSYNFNTLALTRTVGGPNSPAGHAEFRNLAYTAGLKYQYSPRTMFFLANSRGFSAGGLQNVAGFETFKPSVLNNLEAGVKSSFSIGAIKARTNASVFYGKFNDVQVNIFQVVNNTAGVPVATTLTQNAAKANVSGAEGEFTLVPAEGLEVGGFAGYLHNVYTSFPSVNPTTLAPLDLSDTPFLLTPKWKIGLRASYRLPLPLTAGTVTLNLDATHQTEMVNTTLPRTPVNPANPMTGLVCKREHTVANGYPVELADGGTTYVDCVQAFSNVNVGVQWRQPMGAKDLTLQFQVSNLTRNRVTSSQANLRDAGVVAHMPAVPRMWTLRATYDF
jgi:iron complex outermembrane receptor protein